ncbi:TIGR03857 family LLM class F420-dependent oxidoreductase [Actinomadura sp. NPDC000929]|uniref:TIGR03857 family LLM class F420-dependent oxidoreductase n=1 Tax=Actinomadura sp. NPDC000929 TaxID=3154517 RepID=UPI0033988919
MRHPLVTAMLATTMHRMSGGRFALGLERGFDMLFDVMGLSRVTEAQLDDFIGIMRRLWRGEAVVGHDGPAGSHPYLSQDPAFREDIPIMLVAMGERTLEFAGRVADGVVLHTFFTDRTLARAVSSIRRGAAAAGRDPASVRVWSVLATVGDHLDEEARLRKLVGRLATYLQGYGDLLVRVNEWDPADLARFRADDLVDGYPDAFDALATPDELRHLAGCSPSTGWRRRRPALPIGARDASSPSSTPAPTAWSCTAPPPPSWPRSSTPTGRCDPPTGSRDCPTTQAAPVRGSRDRRRARRRRGRLADPHRRPARPRSGRRLPPRSGRPRRDRLLP